MADTSPELLQKNWVHSHEEDTATTRVYRPADFKFPPSRGRRSFLLHPGGAVSEGGIGPTDRQQKSTGRWKMESADTLVLEGAGGTAPRKLKIISATADRLEIAKP